MQPRLQQEKLRVERKTQVYVNVLEGFRFGLSVTREEEVSSLLLLLLKKKFSSLNFAGTQSTPRMS